MSEAEDPLVARIRESLRGSDPDKLRELVRGHREIEEIKKNLGPQTRDELWQFFKDKYDIELVRVAVCPGHVSQLDFVWCVWTFMNVLGVFSRGYGKTSLMALVDDCQAQHYPGWGSFTIGPGKDQGERKYEHLLPFVVEGGVIGGKELPHIERSIMTKTQYKKGSVIEIALGGGVDNANGPRQPRLHRDEIELMLDPTRKQAVNIPAGKKTRDGRYVPAQTVDTSTMKYAGGYVDQEMEAYYDTLKKAEVDPTEMNPIEAFHLSVERGHRPRKLMLVSCFTPDTRVRTEHGLRPISEIVIGDYVLSEGGIYREVTGTTRNWHDGEIRSMRTVVGQTVRVTSDHLISSVYDARDNKVATKPTNRKHGYIEQWIKAGDLQTGNYVRIEVPKQVIDRSVIQPPLATHGDQSNGRARKFFHSFSLTDDFLWSIGLYIAEGSTKIGSLMFSLHEDEVHYEKRIRHTFESLGFIVSRYAYTSNGKGVQIEVNSCQLQEWWSEWLGRGSENKRIPSELINLPEERLSHVIQGILDGDSCERWAALLQTSPVLATQVVESSLRSGGKATINIPKKRPDRKQAYFVINPDSEVRIAPGRDTATKWSHASPRGFWKFNDQRYAKVVSNESEYYEGWVYDLTIGDGSYPSYVVENMLVHNCIYEIAAENPTCRSVPEEERRARLIELDRDPDEICDCNTYVSDVWETDDPDVPTRPRTLEDVCQGRFFKSRGYQRFGDIQTFFLDNDRVTWEAEKECSQPSREGAYLKSYSQDRHGIRGYRPDPENGPIYTATDWGATDEACTLWIQVLEKPVQVSSYKGDKIKTMQSGSRVVFGEFFKSLMGNTEHGNIVNDREAAWFLQWPGWRVAERHSDNADRGAILDWRDQCNLIITNRIKKDFNEEVKLVRTMVGGWTFFIDIHECPNTDKALKGWRQVNGREVRNQHTHPMACLRYFAHERHVVERALMRSGGRPSARPAAAEDEEQRPQERAEELERGVRVIRHGSTRTRELAGAAGAEDSPLREGSSIIGSPDWRTREERTP